jgi:drug/metabolite transporter (DMT)-like permease
MFAMQACIWYSGRTVYVAPEDRMMLFYRCLAGFSSISFAFYAVSQMVLADASVFIFTSPVWSFFLVSREGYRTLRVEVGVVK